jgi:hypothetical protein
LRRAGTENIKDEEWCFDGLPYDQAEFCAFYEYRREVPEIIAALKTWRGRKKVLQSDENWNSPVVALFALRVALGILVECPEFPQQPWRAIPQSTRLERIKRYKKSLLDLQQHYRRGHDESTFKVLDPARHTARLKAMIIRAQTAKQFPESREQLRGEAEDLLCSIDWRAPLKMLVADFQDWARRNRPKSVKLSRNRTLKTFQEQLKALAAWRLLRHFRQFEKTTEAAIRRASDYTQAKTKNAPLDQARESWLRASNEAERNLAALRGSVSAQRG